MSKQTPPPRFYKTCAALASYLDRIGAEEVSPQTYAVVETTERGYTAHRVRIRLRDDGTIIIKGNPGENIDSYKASNKEGEAIADAAADFIAKLPKQILATRHKVNDLAKALGVERGTLRACTDPNADPKDGDVIMVEQRIEEPGKTKYFVRWTFFGNGVWYPVEPKEGLPFWIPDPTLEEKKLPRGERRGKNIMVHEGPTIAEFLTKLKQTPKKLMAHPWGHMLAGYDHWAITGGAKRAHEAMFHQLRDAAPLEVIYVSDNDAPGRGAIPKVAKGYGGPMKCLQFTEQFKEGFDLKDPMPEKLFDKDGIYRGPSFHDLLSSATWMTKLIPTKGRPLIEVTSQFATEWIHSVSPEVFVHRDFPDKLFTEKEFNNKVRPLSHAIDTAGVVKRDWVSKVDRVDYRPMRAEDHVSILSEKGSRIFNAYLPPTVKLVEGNYEPFTDFMKHLIPNEGDRHETERWIATLIDRPDVKMLYALLMISETQGIGKGTLGERILMPLVGHHNTSIVNEQEVTDSSYTYWQAHARLAIIHEIHEGRSSAAYEKLKSTIADDHLEIRRKYLAPYNIENWLHVYACSNSAAALRMSMDDRRWLVPRVTEVKKPLEYWQQFNRWLIWEKGLGKIRFWAQQFLKDNEPVPRGAEAPATDAKRTLVREGYSEAMRCFADRLDELKEEAARKKVHIVTSDVAGREYVKMKLFGGVEHSKLVTLMTLRKVAKERGLAVGSRDRRYRLVDTDPLGILISTDPELVDVAPSRMKGDKGVVIYRDLTKL